MTRNDILSSKSANLDSTRTPRERRPWVTPEIKKIDLTSARVGGSIGGSDAMGSAD